MTKETMTSTKAGKRPARRAWLAVAALIFCGAALIAGCSTSSTTTVSQSPSAPATSATTPPSPSASATASASQAVCMHINSLRTSLNGLTHIKVTATSAGQLTTDLTNIQTQLAALKGQSLGAFSAAANQLTASLDKIKKDAAELSTDPTGAAKSLSSDLTELKSKAGPMITEMKTVCHVS